MKASHDHAADRQQRCSAIGRLQAPKPRCATPSQQRLTLTTGAQHEPRTGGPVSEKVLDRRHEGRVGPPPVKCGRRVLYSMTQVEEWLTQKANHPLRRAGRS